MVDTQSFPFECLAYPKLWQGAYSKREVSPITSIRRPLALLLLFNPCIYTTLTSSKSADLPTHIPSSPPLLLSSAPLSQRYLQSEISAVVEYGRLRGVRVIVEFDMPGHAASWCVDCRLVAYCLVLSLCCLVYSCLVLSCLALCRLSTLHTSVMIHSQHQILFPFLIPFIPFLSFPFLQVRGLPRNLSSS